MRNEKIICRHCGQIIGFVHHIDESISLGNVVIAPNKYSSITQSKVRGYTDTESYGDFEVEKGYILETQLKCNKCNKKTTKKITNYC